MDDSKHDRRSNYSAVTEVQRFSVLKRMLEGAKKVSLINTEAVLGDTKDLYIPERTMPIYKSTNANVTELHSDLRIRINTIRTIAKHRRYDIVVRDPDYIPSDRARFPRTQIDVEYAAFRDDQGNIIEINKQWTEEKDPIRIDLEIKMGNVANESKQDLKSEAGRELQMPRTINVNVPPSPQPRKTQEVSGRV